MYNESLCFPIIELDICLKDLSCNYIQRTRFLENNTHPTVTGKIIQDDMIIISGVGKYGTGPASGDSEVRQAVINVLQDELGFVVETGHGAVYMNHSPCPSDLSNSHVFQTIEEPKYHKYLARRPQDLGVLKVTKRSLHSWLQKKGGP